MTVFSVLPNLRVPFSIKISYVYVVEGIQGFVSDENVDETRSLPLDKRHRLASVIIFYEETSIDCDFSWRQAHILLPISSEYTFEATPMHVPCPPLFWTNMPSSILRTAFVVSD